MKFEITLGEQDKHLYDGALILDFDALNHDMDCDTLIAWEEEADYSLFLLKSQAAVRPARWCKVAVWFALKQAGSDVTYANLKLRGVGGMEVIRTDRGDGRPPVVTSSEGESANPS